MVSSILIVDASTAERLLLHPAASNINRMGSGETTGWPLLLLCCEHLVSMVNRLMYYALHYALQYESSCLFPLWDYHQLWSVKNTQSGKWL